MSNTLINGTTTKWVTPEGLNRYFLGFFGNKRKLLEPIANSLPQATQTVADIFSGSGIVSFFLKRQKFRIICNDIMKLPCLRQRVLIGNNHTILDQKDILLLSEPIDYQPSCITRYYQGTFGAENCKFLERWSTNAQKLTDPLKRDIAIYSCFCGISRHLDFGTLHFNGLGVPTGYKHFGHINFETETCNFALNEFPHMVFDNGVQNSCHNEDALELVSRLGADTVVYADCPYAVPTGDYEMHYSFFDDLTLALARQGERIADPYDGKAELKPYTKFFKRGSALVAFDKLFYRCRHIRTLIISYNTTSKVSPTEIESIAHFYGRHTEVLKIPHIRATPIKGGKRETIEVLIVCT